MNLTLLLPFVALAACDNNEVCPTDQSDTDVTLITNAERLPLMSDNDSNDFPENSYEITERVEMGKMATMFFSKTGVKLFYICITVYLYGDLSIYAAAISKSLRDISW